MPTNTITSSDREQYSRARVAGERQTSSPSVLKAARYVSRRDAVELVFASGGTITVPRRVVPEFADVPADALRGLSVSIAGDAVCCRTLDVDIDVAGLVQSVFGPRLLSSVFARRGGQQTSKAKAAAARANGAKGGRPRNRPARRERPR